METPFVKQPNHEKAQNREKALAMVLRKGFDSQKYWAKTLPEAFGKRGTYWNGRDR